MMARFPIMRSPREGALQHALLSCILLGARLYKALHALYVQTDRGLWVGGVGFCVCRLVFGGAGTA